MRRWVPEMTDFTQWLSRRGSLPSLIALALCAGAALPATTVAYAQAPMQPSISIPMEGSSGDVHFSDVAWVSSGPNGTILVVDPKDAVLRQFSSDGRPIRTFGRKGRGPGEFTRPGWVSQCGTDSVFVWDIATATMTVLDAELQLVRSWTALESRASWRVSCNSRRHFSIVSGARPAQEPSARARRRTSSGTEYDEIPLRGTFTVFDGDGKKIGGTDTIVVGTLFAGPVFPEGRRGEFVHPFGVDIFSILGDSAVMLARSDSAHMLRFAIPDMSPSRVVLDLPLRQYAQRDREQATRRALSTVPAAVSEHLERFIESMATPSRTIAFAEPVASADRLLWFASHPSESHTLLTATNSSGRTVTRVLLLGAVRVFEVSPTRIFGVISSDDGEPRIAVWRRSESR